VRTTAAFLLRGAFHVDHFVNADDIARSLSVLAPKRAAEWRIYDASSVGEPQCVAAGDGCTETVFDSTIWTTMRNEADHG